MADKESPLVQDILFNSTAMISDNNDDCLFPIDFTDIDTTTDFDSFMSSVDIFSSDEETTSIIEFLSNQNFDIPQNSCASQQQHITSSDPSPIDVNYQRDISLSFINPPEPVYHVRYVSEITTAPLDGNIVNTRMKTKKNISGRYLKGIRSRYVTIGFPSILSDHSNLFIRVTRLTLPYQDVSYIHPYPLLYSQPKKKQNSYVIIRDSSIYYKLNKEEICSCSKHFPNLILARLKQCDLKRINDLYSFDDSDISHSFIANNVKNKIAIYKLKQCQLDFRLTIRSEQAKEFFDTDIFCRSNALLEEEGMEWKKSSS